MTPDEVTEYRLGTILNGGGAFRGNNKYATAADWARPPTPTTGPASGYEGRGFRVPFAWATDAVTDTTTCSVRPCSPTTSASARPVTRIWSVRSGPAAAEVTATGLDWTFALTVAVPATTDGGGSTRPTQDPAVVHAYASAMVDGPGTGWGPFWDDRVVSTVKHWVGDGGRSMGSTGAITTTPRTT